MSPHPAVAIAAAAQARRRAEALALALSDTGDWGEDDVAWARAAADSLVRLARHAGVHAPRTLTEAASLDDRPANAVADACRALATRVTGPESPRPTPLGAILDAAAGDADREAGLRGIPVHLDRSGDAGVMIPADHVGPLLDALGLVFRDAVRHAKPSGAAVRVVVHGDRQDLVIDISDRSTGDAPDASGSFLAPGRAPGLRAAAGSLAVVRGELTAGVGPWGGTAVTVRMPRDA